MPHNILWKLPPFITFYMALQSDVKNRTKYVWSAGSEHDTAQKMKFSIKDFFSFFRKLRIWSHLLKKSLMENFIFCAVRIGLTIFRVTYFLSMQYMLICYRIPEY